MRAGLTFTFALALAGCTAANTNRNGTRRAPVAAVWLFTCDPVDARIVLDEVDQGVCLLWTDRAMALGAGTHRLRVEKEGFLPDERDLPPTGARTPLTITLRARPE